MILVIQAEVLVWVEGFKWVIYNGFRKVKMLTDSTELWEGVCLGKKVELVLRGLRRMGLEDLQFW